MFRRPVGPRDRPGTVWCRGSVIRLVSIDGAADPRRQLQIGEPMVFRPAAKLVNGPLVGPACQFGGWIFAAGRAASSAAGTA